MNYINHENSCTNYTFHAVTKDSIKNGWRSSKVKSFSVSAHLKISKDVARWWS